MIVLRKWPAWKGFAMFGEENSTMMRFWPLLGSLGSRRPRFMLRPKLEPSVRIVGMTVLTRGAVLTNQWRK